MNSSPQPDRPPATGRRPGMRLVRWGIVAIVLAAFAWTIWKAARELSDTPFEWSKLGWLELLFAGIAYGVALACGARMWQLVLGSMSVTVPYLTAAHAFAASQLAKYVPGKAMVLVVRCGLLCSSMVKADSAPATPSRVWLGPIIASTFVETLMWVLVGAQLGCVGLLFRPGISPELFWGALAVMLCFGLLTLPPVFSRAIQTLAKFKRISNWDPQSVKLDWLTYGRAWSWSLIGWVWYGAAMFAILGAVSAEPLGWELYGLALTTICLATVGGFLSMLPGGLGVRELVMLPLLSGTLTTAGALIAAILMRLVCVAVELLLSGLCHGLSRARATPSVEA
ncbi:MAG: lysylphosphatidylglycerol synthase domain-containing protein [Planctomycetota bacterium]|jgi:hypothetical protein